MAPRSRKRARTSTSATSSTQAGSSSANVASSSAPAASAVTAPASSTADNAEQSEDLDGSQTAAPTTNEREEHADDGALAGDNDDNRDKDVAEAGDLGIQAEPSASAAAISAEESQASTAEEVTQVAAAELDDEASKDEPDKDAMDVDDEAAANEQEQENDGEKADGDTSVSSTSRSRAPARKRSNGAGAAAKRGGKPSKPGPAARARLKKAAEEAAAAAAAKEAGEQPEAQDEQPEAQDEQPEAQDEQHQQEEQEDKTEEEAHRDEHGEQDDEALTTELIARLAREDAEVDAASTRRAGTRKTRSAAVAAAAAVTRTTVAMQGEGSRRGGGGRARSRSKAPKHESDAARDDEPQEDGEPTPSKARRAAAAAANAANAAATSSQRIKDEDDDDEEEEEEEYEYDPSEVTRCVCGKPGDEDENAFMIQCEKCSCWQHGTCVGLWGEEECPDVYYCERCKPGWHSAGGLLRPAYRKSRGAVASTSADEPPARARSATAESSKKRRSPAHGGPPSAPPKKRNTMNSRDAAYDDAIALSILGPGSAAMRARWEKTRQSDSADPEDDAAESMRQQVEATLDAVSELAAEGDTEGAANLLAGAPASTVAALGLPPRPEADEEDIQVEVQDEDRIQTPDADQGIPLAVDEPKEAERPTAPAPSKPKHPNQYTYRPKNGQPVPPRARTSPTKRGSGRVEGARAWAPGDSLSWGMPDHLSHLAHLLPTPQPQPIEVTVSELLPPAQDVGTSKSGSAPPRMLKTQLEAPTRVKFPGKRITMPEMKKRSRIMLEYIARMQLEMSERESKRAALKSALQVSAAAQDDERVPAAATAASMLAAEPDDDDGGDPASSSESAELMDTLSRDIYHFQSRFFGE